MSTVKQKREIIIRCMIRRDIPEVLSIETESFEFPWTESGFICCLRQPNCTGMVAEHKKQVVGFMIYELCKTEIHLLNFAVHPDWQRQNIGTQMIKKLITELSPQKRRKIIDIEIRETNLPAQLFLRNCGFRAINILRGYYDDISEDAYLMQYRYKAPQK